MYPVVDLLEVNLDACKKIRRTLEKNVSGLRRLKILIHGQEVDTLAGHVDLTGFFDLNSAAGPTVPSTPAQDLPPTSAR